jgi:hypothetical protein
MALSSLITCPRCRGVLSLGGEPMSVALRAITRCAHCQQPPLGECLVCGVVWHGSNEGLVPHASVTYRLPQADDGIRTMNKQCAACKLGKHDQCFKTWHLDVHEKRYRYVCACVCGGAADDGSELDEFSGDRDDA